MSVVLLACGCERRETQRPWLSRPHVNYRCRQCASEDAQECWDDHTRAHYLQPASLAALAERRPKTQQAVASAVDPALVDAFAHAIAKMPTGTTKTTQPHRPRVVPFADRYPDAARRGRKLGAQHRVRFPGDPYALAASLGYSVRLVTPHELPEFPGNRHAQAILVPATRRILVDVSLDLADRDKAVAHECGHVITGYTRRPMSELTALGWDDPDEVAAESFAFAFLRIQS